MRITLAVTAGPHEGRSFTFDGHDTFIVGRSERAHFRLSVKDRYFSRIHFMVEVNPPHCRLMDLRSRNGTYVNGVKVAAADLKNGDEIKAGKTILRVAFDQESPATPSVSDSQENAAIPDPFGTAKPAKPVTPDPPEPVQITPPRNAMPACAANRLLPDLLRSGFGGRPDVIALSIPSQSPTALPALPEGHPEPSPAYRRLPHRPRNRPRRNGDRLPSAAGG